MTKRAPTFMVAWALCCLACVGIGPGCQSKEVEAKPSLELERTHRERKAVPQADPEVSPSWSPGTLSPKPAVLSESEKIERLLTALESSDAVFIRNGSEYSGRAAADHLRTKLKNSGGKITTAKDFIDRLASKSSMSGKPYQVRMAEGSVVESGVWFSGLLATIEGGTGK